jgi:hypothetical protein
MNDSKELSGKWADPGVIGLYLVGAVVFGGLFPLNAGFVSPSAAPLLGGFFFVSGIAWLVLTVVNLKNGDMWNAIQTGAFGVLFGLAPGIGLLLPVLAKCAGMEVDTRLLGWYLMYVGVVFLIMAIPSYKIIKSLAFTYVIVFFAAGICGAVFAGYLSPGMLKVASWLFLYIGLWFTYIPTAITINTVYRKAILPIG